METILALAILALAMAAVGELIRTGVRAAAGARDITMAQIIAESRINEILAGAVPAESSGGQPYELDEEWTIDTDVQPNDLAGLLSVTVVAYRSETNTQNGVSFSLTSWMIDPALAIDDTVATEMADDAAVRAAASSSSSSSSATGGTP